MRQHEYYDFTPPAEQGSGRSLALALLVHGLLILALTWGVTWHSEKSEPPVQAELWTTVPEPVAHKTLPLEPSPPPPPPVANPAKPIKQPPEPVKPLSSNREKASPDADIAIQKQKKQEAIEQDKRKEADKKAAKAKEEAEVKEAKAKKEAEEKKVKLDKEEAKRLEIKKQKEEDSKRAELKKLKEEEAKRIEEQKRKDDEAKHAEEQKRKDEEAKRIEEQKRKDEETKRLAEEKRESEERRKEQINKLKQLGANSTGPTVSSSAAKASASSGAYNKKLYDRVKPNINTFPESQLQAVKGNPEAEVIVSCGPNGKILQAELSRPSGIKSWDDTVLKGVEKTGTLPLDENGNCPAKIIFVFKLRGD